MNHDETLGNRAALAADHPEDGCGQCCGDDLLFAMRDLHHEFSLGITTVLQCLRMAEREGVVPMLPDDWWIAVARRYRIPHQD